MYRFRVQQKEDRTWETIGDHATEGDARFQIQECQMQDHLASEHNEYQYEEYRTISVA